MLVEDLEVYQRLFKLTLEVHELTMTFAKEYLTSEKLNYFIN